jgi:lysine-specific permease
MIAGISIFFVVSSLGEMATLIPCSGSFSTYASRFVDPALGFTLGWNYCLLWFIVLPLEVMASAAFLQFWMTGVSRYIL